MAASDLPEAAVEAALVEAERVGVPGLLATRILAAAAPHMHTDCGCAAACVAKPGIRAQVLADEGEPEPCPLDHSCDPDELCGCRCYLHDCEIAECPSFQYVERVIGQLKTDGQRLAKDARVHERAQVLAEVDAVLSAVLPDSVYRDLMTQIQERLER